MSKQKQKKTIYVHIMFSDVLSLQFSIFMINLLSYYGLVNAKIRASDIDLPVRKDIGFAENSNSIRLL